MYRVFLDMRSKNPLRLSISGSSWALPRAVLLLSFVSSSGSGGGERRIKSTERHQGGFILFLPWTCFVTATQRLPQPPPTKADFCRSEHLWFIMFQRPFLVLHGGKQDLLRISISSFPIFLFVCDDNKFATSPRVGKFHILSLIIRLRKEETSRTSFRLYWESWSI